jgi:hypothetical protein
LNPEVIFTCRLIVGRYGEMDIARWWNVSGILSPLGCKVVSRGLPRTEFYGRARALFAIAAHRTRVFFSPPNSYTLWSLPPLDENALDDAMIRWAHEGRTWPEIDALLLQLRPGGLEPALRQANLLSESVAAQLSRMKTGPEGKSIRLSETEEITDETVKLLACAFLRSSPELLLLPVVGLKGGGLK